MPGRLRCREGGAVRQQRERTGLTTCDISDACDDLGVSAARMGSLGPIWSGCPPLSGTVSTVSLLAGRAGGSPLPELVEALRSATEPLVLVDLGGRLDVQCWGSVLATVASSFGLAGAIVNGAVRDVEGLAEMGFPTYARGVVPVRTQDRVRFVRAGAAADIDGVAVRPGWLAVADLNGAVFVPPEAAGAVVDRARAAAAEERRVLAAVRAGSDPAVQLGYRRGSATGARG